MTDALYAALNRKIQRLQAVLDARRTRDTRRIAALTAERDAAWKRASESWAQAVTDAEQQRDAALAALREARGWLTHDRNCDFLYLSTCGDSQRCRCRLEQRLKAIDAVVLSFMGGGGSAITTAGNIRQALPDQPQTPSVAAT